MDKTRSELNNSDNKDSKDNPNNFKNLSVADSRNRPRVSTYTDENFQQMKKASSTIVSEIIDNISPAGIEVNNSKKTITASTNRINDCACDNNVSGCSHKIYIRHVTPNVMVNTSAIVCPLPLNKENVYFNINAQNNMENTSHSSMDSKKENHANSTSKYIITSKNDLGDKCTYKNEISQCNRNFHDVGVSATICTYNNQDLTTNGCTCTSDNNKVQVNTRYSSPVHHTGNEQPSSSRGKYNNTHTTIQAQACGSKVVLLYCSSANNVDERRNIPLPPNNKYLTCNTTIITEYCQDDLDGSKKHQSMVDTHNLENIRRNQDSQFQNERIICPPPASTTDESFNILISQQGSDNPNTTNTYTKYITEGSDFTLLSHAKQKTRPSEIGVLQLTDKSCVQTKFTQTISSTSPSEIQMHETRSTKLLQEDSSQLGPQNIKLMDDYPCHSRTSEKSDVQREKSFNSNLQTLWHSESQNRSNHLPRGSYFSQNLPKDNLKEKIDIAEFSKDDESCTKRVKILYDSNPVECESVDNFQCDDNKEEDPNVSAQNSTDCIKKFSYQRLQPILTKCLSKVSQISSNGNKK